MVDNVEHRNRRQYLYSLRPGMCKLQGSITLGPFGAIASDGYALRGLRSSSDTSTPPVSKLGTGKYRLRFADDWLGVNGFSFGWEDSAQTDAYNVLMLDSSKVASDNYVDIQFVNTSNAAVDVGNSKLWLEFSLRTSERG